MYDGLYYGIGLTTEEHSSPSPSSSSPSFYASPLSSPSPSPSSTSSPKPSPSPPRLSKEEKKRKIQEKMDAQIAEKRSASEKIKEEREKKRKEESKGARGHLDEIDKKIGELKSQNTWGLSFGEREKVKEKIKHLEEEKQTFRESAPGRKVFVGKLGMEDLEEKLKMNPPLIEKCCQLRRQFFQEEFQKFGRVEGFEWREERGCLFITFEDKEGAKRMMKEMKEHEKRKELVERVGERVEEKRAAKVVVPKGMFYVRWPKNYLNQKKKLKEMEKEKKKGEGEGGSGVKGKEKED